MPSIHNIPQPIYLATSWLINLAKASPQNIEIPIISTEIAQIINLDFQEAFIPPNAQLVPIVNASIESDIDSKSNPNISIAYPPK